ncbi:MAG TPA: ABC transporter ATP-binding protein [Candidatus Limnocylindrales bacterium]|nr:ABC transporter ATP-binding protein [Candidatus Limnocylindrales bacterium]
MTVAQTVTAPALEMRGITKRYPGVVANDGIDLEIRPGEIHALLGENGAGKSTLMNILYGLATPDEGEILLDGEVATIHGPSDAIDRGISMVHQHFMLVPVLSVADNILLGEETMANPIFLDRKEAHRRIIELGKRFGFEIDPEARISSLSVGWQQRVEILKALYRQARILVLDEPTAVLTPQETKEIFDVLKRLADEGHSIIFISHKLYEVLEIADRITVIRRGKVVGSRLPSETDEDDLAALMVGRNVQLVVDRGESHPAEPALTVTDLRVADDRGHEAVKGVTFDVRAGEILGIAGVAGNGQDELVEALTGLRNPTSGTVSLNGKAVTGAGPRDLQRAGMSFVPGDRHRFGLVLGFSLEDNLVLTQYDEAPYARGPFRNDGAIREWAIRAIGEYDIRTPSPSVDAGTLSGGNQQKAIVAREFSRELTTLVLDQPTRGLDVGSIEFIHRQVIAKRDTGAAILLVSAELDEVMELSDRIAVMFRGEIVALVDGPTAEREEIGLLMATGRRDPDALAAASTSMAAAAAIEAEPVETVAATADVDAAPPDAGATEAGPPPDAPDGAEVPPDKAPPRAVDEAPEPTRPQHEGPER